MLVIIFMITLQCSDTVRQYKVGPSCRCSIKLIGDDNIYYDHAHNIYEQSVMCLNGSSLGYYVHTSEMK